jgi:hypothetical protein
MLAITLFTSLDGTPINKIVRREPDGSTSRGMAKNGGRFTARTVPAADLAALAQVLRAVGKRSDQAISLSLFKDAPEGDFLVVPAAELAARLGVEPSDREALAGFHELDGVYTAARIKPSMVLGSWLLFDRDQVAEMPATLADLSFAQWRQAIDLLFPGFASAGCVVVPSASTRVTVDGARLASTSTHVFVRVDDPAEIPRAWSQATLRALITAHAGTPLAFARPKRSRATGEVVAVDWATLYDRSTAAPARLVFDGAPIVSGEGLEVLPPAVTVHKGPALELGRVPDLRPRKEVGMIAEALGEIRGTQPRVALTRHGGRVTGVELVTADLELDQALETPAGRTTVAELRKAGAGHTRCQSPFRESSSWAAFYGTHGDGMPFVYDTGTNEKHVLRREGRAPISAILRAWLDEELGPQFKGPDGAMFSGRLGRWVRQREVQPADELIDRLAMASDAPCDAQGRVKRHALPAQFRNWLPIAWGTLYRQLPAEEEVEVASAPAGEELSQYLVALLTSIVPLEWAGYRRHSLGAWARYHAALRPDRWCRVGPYACWSRTTGDGMQIAIRPELAGPGQVRCPEIAALSQAKLTRLCRQYGLGVEDNRVAADGRQIRATILNEAFVASLALPDVEDDALAAALHERMAERPN